MLTFRLSGIQCKSILLSGVWHCYNRLFCCQTEVICFDRFFVFAFQLQINIGHEYILFGCWFYTPKQNASTPICLFLLTGFLFSISNQRLPYPKIKALIPAQHSYLFLSNCGLAYIKSWHVQTYCLRKESQRWNVKHSRCCKFQFMKKIIVNLFNLATKLKIAVDTFAPHYFYSVRRWSGRMHFQMAAFNIKQGGTLIFEKKKNISLILEKKWWFHRT